MIEKNSKQWRKKEKTYMHTYICTYVCMYRRTWYINLYVICSFLVCFLFYMFIFITYILKVCLFVYFLWFWTILHAQIQNQQTHIEFLFIVTSFLLSVHAVHAKLYVFKETVLFKTNKQTNLNCFSCQ